MSYSLTMINHSNNEDQKVFAYTRGLPLEVWLRIRKRVMGQMLQTGLTVCHEKIFCHLIEHNSIYSDCKIKIFWEYQCLGHPQYIIWSMRSDGFFLLSRRETAIQKTICLLAIVGRKSKIILIFFRKMVKFQLYSFKWLNSFSWQTTFGWLVFYDPHSPQATSGWQDILCYKGVFLAQPSSISMNRESSNFHCHFWTKTPNLMFEIPRVFVILFYQTWYALQM